MGVVEHQLIRVLRKARDLLRAGLVETLLVKLHPEATGQHGGVDFQLVRIGGIGFAHRLHIFFQAQAVEAGLLQILRGTYKCARLAADRGAKRAKGAAGFRGKKHQRFFGLFGNCDEYAFFVDGLAPGFHAGKPGFGRRIGSASQERDHHQVAHRLAVWEIGMNPKHDLQPGDLGPRQWARSRRRAGRAPRPWGQSGRRRHSAQWRGRRRSKAGRSKYRRSHFMAAEQLS